MGIISITTLNLYICIDHFKRTLAWLNWERDLYNIQFINRTDRINRRLNRCKDSDSHDAVGRGIFLRGSSLRVMSVIFE